MSSRIKTPSGDNIDTAHRASCLGAALLVSWVLANPALADGSQTCVAPERPLPVEEVTTERVFQNISFEGFSPISLSQPPGDPSRWIIAGRLGELFSFANDQAATQKTLVLDITDRMQYTDTVDDKVDSQQYGITSFAMHPQFPEQPFIYVAYNAKPSISDEVHSVVSRFTSSDGGQTFNSSSEQTVISIAQQRFTHHIGQILFGPDGYLYIGLGDGGKQNAQDLNDLRGSVLRIDVDQGTPYAIPPDNPLVGSGYREEIYAWGFRNPWRFTFDSATGQLWLGDVGALFWEEVDLVESGGNYGWPIFEGLSCFREEKYGCDATGLVEPVLTIEHPDARAIIGGYVYRGTQIPSLQGTYIFSDSEIRGVFFDEFGDPLWDVVAQTQENAHGFAEALDGELYLFNFQFPELYKLVATDLNPPPSTFPELLSETGCVDPFSPTVPAPGLIPYTVNTLLWSDGAEKGRWMALPDGASIDIAPDGNFEFPIDTVLMKNFAFGGIPHETRLLVRHDDGGWAGYSYEWNEDLTDAALLPAGKSKVIAPGLTWAYPSRNQCMECHTVAAGFGLGVEIPQLNGTFIYPATGTEGNQLDILDSLGLFSGGLPQSHPELPALASMTDDSVPLERRARSYLHTNCSGCHRPGGTVQSPIDFRFSTAIEDMNVCDVIPYIDDLGISEAKILSPGDPDNSIISVRLHSENLNRMPPLGVTIADVDAIAVIDAWISQTDVCVVYPDSDGDMWRDNVDNCPAIPNPDQADDDGDGRGNVCHGLPVGC